MKILFDLSASQPNGNVSFHGGSEYCKAIFYELSKNGNSKETSIEIFYDPNIEIDNELIDICQENKYIINKCSTHTEISKLLFKRKFDVFYSALPYKYGDLKIPNETKFIYTVHGLRILECPYDKYMNKYSDFNLISTVKLLLKPIVWKIIQKKYKQMFDDLFNCTTNRHIITVSRHSKYSMKYFFPSIDFSEVDVLYSPHKFCNEKYDCEEGVLENFKVKKNRYILLISGDRWEKNAYRAVQAVDILFSKYSKSLLKGFKIIVLGTNEKLRYIKSIKNEKNFVFCGYIPSKELEILYKYAHIFIYPTLNEGFGYPPLEAMKYNTLSACSANSSITEVCGDSVLYFNPYDIKEIGIRILESFDKNIYKDKVIKMKKQFSYINDKQEEALNNIIRLLNK